MARVKHTPLNQPDEIRTYPGGQTEIFEMADFVIGRMVMQPAWSWRESVGPIVGTERCMVHHLGYVISGRLRVLMRDGTQMELGPREMFEIPPEHDAEVIGDEPWEAIDFRGARGYARPDWTSGDRILRTLLFTDIVDSTKSLERLGDARWRELLRQHNELMQVELDRYRGREVKKTGDGVLAIFDGPARAVECARAMVRQVKTTGLEIRAGVHTGEIELVPDDVHGMAVHMTARIMALAGPNEIFVSTVTRDLLAGSGLMFESRGTYTLKGIEGDREILALAS